MPPIPSDFNGVAKCGSNKRRISRTRLCFGDEKVIQQSAISIPTELFPFANDDSGIDFDHEVRQFLTPSPRSKRHRGESPAALTPELKRRRTETEVFSPRLSESEAAPSPVSAIIRAVERLSTESDLVADASRDNVLSTVPGKHPDLNSISADTMTDVLRGCYDDKFSKITVIDCRYPYEFEGGHIKGAINLYTKASVQKFLQETPALADDNHVLIFHCEFSSERGPKMYRHLRSLDRELNKDSYPKLNFPEMYLLEGGYKDFYQTNKELCDPQEYTPMLHASHSEDLRHFRVKSKSWAAGDKPRYRSRVKSGMSLLF